MGEEVGRGDMGGWRRRGDVGEKGGRGFVGGWVRGEDREMGKGEG